MKSEPIATRVFIERSTGKIVKSAGYVYEEDWPYKDVHPLQPLIRYIDLNKLEDLLKSKTLYLRRADKFEDSLEGTLSRAGVNGTSRTDNSFAENVRVAAKSYDERSAYRKIANGVHFVSCWHINERLNPWMWTAYTKSPYSVAIMTTRIRLERAIQRPLLMSCVKYVNENTPRTEHGESSLLLYKDEFFSFEREFRIIATMTDLGDTRIRSDDPNDFFRRIPINIETLIKGIALHPYAIGSVAERVKALVEEHAPFLVDTSTEALTALLAKRSPSATPTPSQTPPPPPSDPHRTAASPDSTDEPASPPDP